MRLLIDENLPKRIKNDFQDHEIFTVSDKGWRSKSNGDLLKLMLKEEFDIFLTFDKNLQYQQNFEKYPISVFVLNAEDNTYPTLKPLLPKLQHLLSKNKKLRTGPIEIS